MSDDDEFKIDVYSDEAKLKRRINGDGERFRISICM